MLLDRLEMVTLSRFESSIEEDVLSDDDGEVSVTTQLGAEGS